MSLISIITVNYNQPGATLALLQSIEQHYPKGNIEVIVVDNGSKVDFGKRFIDQREDLIYIRSEQNLGFAGGNNLGLKRATGDLLFLVNNDTEFTAGILETLSESLHADPRIGIVSPKILYYDEPTIIQYAGFTSMNFYTCRNKCIGQFEQDLGQYDHILAETGFAHGAAMMITRKALQASGPMAENFFLYFEEMDWCERIKRAGFKVYVNTEASIFHKESLSVGKNSALKEYFMNRNRLLFIRRNATLLQRIFFYFYFCSLVVPRNILNYLRSGNSSYVSILFRAISWNLKNDISSSNLGYTF
jgi:GT2 family glycosyltransferase